MHACMYTCVYVSRQTTCISSTTDQDYWQEMLQEMLRELRHYKNIHGHVHVPKGAEREFDGAGCKGGRGSFGHFIWHVRQCFRKGTLGKEREQELTSIGFVFDGVLATELRSVAATDSAKHKNKVSKKLERTQVLVGSKLSWEKRFELLKIFERENRHAHVPKEHAILGKWVKEQRACLRENGVLPHGRRNACSAENAAIRYHLLKKIGACVCVCVCACVCMYHVRIFSI